MQNDFVPQGPTKPAPTKLKPTSAKKTNQEQAVPFQTPDQVSEHDQGLATVPIDPSATPPVRGSGHHWFNLPWPPNRVEIIAIGVVLIIAIFGVAGFAILHKPKAVETVATITPVKQAAPKPTTVASTLSGLPVQPEINQRPVVGVMIENSQEARPQSGLSEAGVVFEAIAEGGITRFLALFQDQQPTNIGPVRSARPYYVQWSEGFRAAYVHVGGSPAALQNIKDWNVQDINQFYNAGPFHRVSSRPSPHNMYSNVVDLANVATQKGYKSEFTGFARKAAKAVTPPTASLIDLNISSSLYNVHYAYDAASNSYIRSEGGAEQIDNNTGKHLTPNVVIAMVVPVAAGAKTAQGGSYSDYNPLGSGVAYVFQDGVATAGSWHKATNTAQITFTDASGAALKLNPGQTWISAVTAPSKVTYK
ncbi:MAG: hypothetical protein JWN82_246 [Candidatus Saccharibacteria bacterium]|nr:hypothetical protein [Candidatus Saccharibacteria bacterium]